MELIAQMKECMSHYHVAGLSIAIIEQGRISVTESCGVVDNRTRSIVNHNTRFNACSISKFATSVLVLKLSEQGTLNLDEDINVKLTSWQVPDHELTVRHKITIRHLLSHQAGILDPEGSFTELTPAHESPNMVDLLEGRTVYCNQPIRVCYEPGTDFHYSDAGYCIIQQLIEDVCGKPIEIVFKEHLFEPLHMNNSIIPTSFPPLINTEMASGHHKDGSVWDGKYPVYPYPAAAGLWTTPSDLALLAIEIMDCLQGNSKLGLSSSTIADMTSPQGDKAWAGLGVFLEGSKQEVEVTSLGWGEGFQCLLVTYPYSRTGAVIMMNTNLGVHQYEGVIGDILNFIKPTIQQSN